MIKFFKKDEERTDLEKIVYEDCKIIAGMSAFFLLVIIILVVARSLNWIEYDIEFIIVGISLLVTPGLATLNKREEMLLQKKIDKYDEQHS